MPGRLIALIWNMKKDIEKTHVSAYAAQSAYFIMLSYLPMMIMLLSLIQFTGIGKAEVYRLIQTMMPLGFQSWVISMIDEMYSRTIATVSISALVMIWSAGKSFMALNRGMDAICRVDKKPNYLIMRLRGALFALVFVMLTVASLLLIVFGSSIHSWIKLRFPLLAIFTHFLLSFRLVIMLALFMIFFAFLYTWLPNRKTTFADQLPGALFASVAWYLFSFGFSIYIRFTNAYTMYGSLTTLMLFMFWLYFVMYLVLLGVELNHLRLEI